MSRIGVEQLLYLLDEAFDGEGGWHSLLGNLRSVKDEDWLWVPPGGERSIAAIAGHVGACKLMYDNYAFGDGTMTWEDRRITPQEGRTPDMTRVIRWVEAAHEEWRWHVAELNDENLETPRKSNWGEVYPTRWLVMVMIQHDVYHAGEINHIRALRQGDDY